MKRPYHSPDCGRRWCRGCRRQRRIETENRSTKAAHAFFVNRGWRH